MIENSTLIYYMNPGAGIVQTGYEWIDDQKHDGSPLSDLDALIEVEWNSINQCWKDVI